MHPADHSATEGHRDLVNEDQIGLVPLETPHTNLSTSTTPPEPRSPVRHGPTRDKRFTTVREKINRKHIVSEKEKVLDLSDVEEPLSPRARRAANRTAKRHSVKDPARVVMGATVTAALMANVAAHSYMVHSSAIQSSRMPGALASAAHPHISVLNPLPQHIYIPQPPTTFPTTQYNCQMAIPVEPLPYQPPPTMIETGPPTLGSANMPLDPRLLAQMHSLSSTAHIPRAHQPISSLPLQQTLPSSATTQLGSSILTPVCAAPAGSLHGATVRVGDAVYILHSASVPLGSVSITPHASPVELPPASISYDAHPSGLMLPQSLSMAAESESSLSDVQTLTDAKGRHREIASVLAKENVHPMQDALVNPTTTSRNAESVRSPAKSPSSALSTIEPPSSCSNPQQSAHKSGLYSRNKRLSMPSRPTAPQSTLNMERTFDVTHSVTSSLSSAGTAKTSDGVGNISATASTASMVTQPQLVVPSIREGSHSGLYGQRIRPKTIAPVPPSAEGSAQSTRTAEHRQVAAKSSASAPNFQFYTRTDKIATVTETASITQSCGSQLDGKQNRDVTSVSSGGNEGSGSMFASFGQKLSPTSVQIPAEMKKTPQEMLKVAKKARGNQKNLDQSKQAGAGTTDSTMGVNDASVAVHNIADEAPAASPPPSAEGGVSVAGVLVIKRSRYRKQVRVFQVPEDKPVSAENRVESREEVVTQCGDKTSDVMKDTQPTATEENDGNHPNPGTNTKSKPSLYRRSAKTKQISFALNDAASNSISVTENARNGDNADPVSSSPRDESSDKSGSCASAAPGDEEDEDGDSEFLRSVMAQVTSRAYVYPAAVLESSAGDSAHDMTPGSMTDPRSQDSDNLVAAISVVSSDEEDIQTSPLSSQSSPPSSPPTTAPTHARPTAPISIASPRIRLYKAAYDTAAAKPAPLHPSLARTLQRIDTGSSDSSKSTVFQSAFVSLEVENTTTKIDKVCDESSDACDISCLTNPFLQSACSTPRTAPSVAPTQDLPHTLTPIPPLQAGPLLKEKKNKSLVSRVGLENTKTAGSASQDGETRTDRGNAGLMEQLSHGATANAENHQVYSTLHDSTWEITQQVSAASESTHQVRRRSRRGSSRSFCENDDEEDLLFSSIYSSLKVSRTLPRNFVGQPEPTTIPVLEETNRTREKKIDSATDSDDDLSVIRILSPAPNPMSPCADRTAKSQSALLLSCRSPRQSHASPLSRFHPPSSPAASRFLPPASPSASRFSPLAHASPRNLRLAPNTRTSWDSPLRTIKNRQNPLQHMGDECGSVIAESSMRERPRADDEDELAILPAAVYGRRSIFRSLNQSTVSKTDDTNAELSTLVRRRKRKHENTNENTGTSVSVHRAPIEKQIGQCADISGQKTNSASARRQAAFKSPVRVVS